ncbi:hypothetical protein DICVIV_12203 [Dictyocaulus viviparus]|uniref:Uncharacterized protein n=1 Tax=Dictyocaulus viviparus TaxID=29172 RepID=A0A0D8XB35_DICVI|nr:hypothetical protein DICVIV_12203 [Dictyocaulus viviparus]
MYLLTVLRKRKCTHVRLWSVNQKQKSSQKSQMVFCAHWRDINGLNLRGLCGARSVLHMEVFLLIIWDYVER